MGHKIDQQGTRPVQDKLEALTKIIIPKKRKRGKVILGRNPIVSKYMENLSANTDFLRKLLKKQNDWIWTDEHTKAFHKLKEGITKVRRDTAHQC